MRLRAVWVERQDSCYTLGLADGQYPTTRPSSQHLVAELLNSPALSTHKSWKCVATSLRFLVSLSIPTPRGPVYWVVRRDRAPEETQAVHNGHSEIIQVEYRGRYSGYRPRDVAIKTRRGSERCRPCSAKGLQTCRLCLCVPGESGSTPVTHCILLTARENEEEVGQGIKASGVKREDIFLTSKLYVPRSLPNVDAH